MGGGTFGDDLGESGREGLSPRGRGNRAYDPALDTDIGSIPAWAGEPHQRARDTSSRWVYPRVGGGTIIAKD